MDSKTNLSDASGKWLASAQAVQVGEASKLYELNVWAMTLGRGKEYTVTIQNQPWERNTGSHSYCLWSACPGQTL